MAEQESLFSVREITRVTERWYEVDEWLAEVAPQAMLRDLHRPTTSFSVGMLDFERHELVRDGGYGAVKDTKKTLYADYRVPIVELAQTPKMWKEGMAELRGILNSPWADAPKLGGTYTSWQRGF